MWRPPSAGQGSGAPDYAAEADVRRGRVDRLELAGGRAVAQAVVRRAQVRAALDHATRDVLTRLGRRAARPCGTVPPALVARPFPHVARHVDQPVAVGLEGTGRRGAGVAVAQQVLPRELTLPGVGHHPSARCELVAPGEDGALETAARRVLPLRLRRQRLAGPGGIRLRILVGDLG